MDGHADSLYPLMLSYVLDLKGSLGNANTVKDAEHWATQFSELTVRQLFYIRALISFLIVFGAVLIDSH
jgi:hypothetical protein